MGPRARPLPASPRVAEPQQPPARHLPRLLQTVGVPAQQAARRHHLLPLLLLPHPNLCRHASLSQRRGSAAAGGAAPAASAAPAAPAAPAAASRQPPCRGERVRAPYG